MKILGIETSCDETACAVVENGKHVLANVVASQIDLHAKTGGVVPEVAAREHVLKMTPVLDECLLKAHCSWDEIDAVAVTKGPGLVSSLIIGTETANVISFLKNKPLIPVHHIIGHIYSNWLDIEDNIEFPVIILTVSGGHNELILMRDHGKFEILGETRDDAAGEAFDKVARILGLGYPGGPAISKIAEIGNPSVFDLPRIFLEKGSLDFSFSGLKTAVLNEVVKLKSVFKTRKLKADLAASFQEAVVAVLAQKLFLALEKFPEAKELHLSGGVSANKRLREIVEEIIHGKYGSGKSDQRLAYQFGQKFSKIPKLRYPKSIAYCTDNAAMIAAAGYFLYKKAPKKFNRCENVIPTTSFEIW